jgi:hypothetical protein
LTIVKTRFVSEAAQLLGDWMSEEVTVGAFTATTCFRASDLAVGL